MPNVTTQAKAAEWLSAAAANIQRAILQLEEAKEYAHPPYMDEIRQQIKALRSIEFCANDLAAQLTEEKPCRT